MANTNNSGILFIDRNHLEYFDFSKPKPLTFNFPPSIIKDMEVLNRHDLETQLILFLNFYKLNPLPLIVVLSTDICFETEINDTVEANFEIKNNSFLELIPFEENIHKIYKLAKGYKLCAVNKELIDTFKTILIKMGFSLATVIPASVSGINIKSIDAPSASYLFAKINQLKIMSIIQAENFSNEKQVEPKKVLGIKRIFLLLSLFLLLLLTLLYLLYQQTMVPVS